MKLTAFAALALGTTLTLGQPPSSSVWPVPDWTPAEPHSVGLDVTVLDAFDKDLADVRYGNVDSFLVIRHGRLAYERSYKRDYDRIYRDEAQAPGPLNANDPSGPYNYFNPWWHPFYHRGDLHTMQSVSKTVTSVVVGVATKRQEFPALDTPVLKFFDPAKVAHVDDRKRRMTIRHLLTMTAGLDWNEDLPYADPKNDSSLMEATFDWVQYTIDKPMAAEPGTTFRYNSGATQLLAYVFRNATGADLEEYAARHLFAPLGIERYFWKRSPTGLIDAEGGLFLRPRDLARVAYLYLHDGTWNGTAVVTPEWVKQSIAPAIDVSSDGVKYGFKWWLYPYGAVPGRLVFAGSGFGGQRPIVLPEYDLVCVFTGWNVLPNRPSLSPRVAIDRVIAAIADRQ